MENLFRNIVYGSMALTLLTTPVAAQQKMNEMWGNGQQAKEINNTLDLHPRITDKIEKINL